MLPELWEKEIININKEVNWVEETSKQLIKDFVMLDIQLSFKPFETEPYKELFVEARKLIAHLFENEHHRFLNLLYRIDLPESQLNELIHSTVPPELYDKITEMVLKREFMKVVIRYRYSQ